MAEEALVLELLRRGGWGEDAGLVEGFFASPAFPLLREALAELRREALYMSHVHGVGHIERTMLHGAMGAAAEPLSGEDTRLLLAMCAYHDTGRVCDYLDGAHGARSAERLASLTGLTGEALREAMAGVEAHSLGDGAMEGILARYSPADLSRARLLAQLLKDADGLDRVRIHDLNLDYLRRPASRDRGRFALALFERYAAEEAARGVNAGIGGYDLPTIHRMKEFVSSLLARGKTCGETALLAWESLGGGRSAASAPGPKPEEDCCILTAALGYFDRELAAEGRSREEREEKHRRFRERFRSQYGSSRCGGLRPKSGCGGFMVDGVLFAWEFYKLTEV